MLVEVLPALTFDTKQAQVHLIFKVWVYVNNMFLQAW